MAATQTRGLVVHRELRHESVLMRALRGNLDEAFDPKVVDPADAQYLVLDLQRVAHVSSFGVRDWINAMKAVRRKLGGLYHINASPRMTDQFNMVVGFDGGGSLLLFETGYICECEGEEFSYLFDAIVDRATFTDSDDPERQCIWCGRLGELDDDPSILFEHVRTAPVPDLPDVVTSTLQHEDSWLHRVPGQALFVRRRDGKGGKFLLRLNGVIDESFPLEELVQQVAGGAIISMQGIRHITDAGADKLSELCAARPRLVRVPPVVLRRAHDDPHMIAGATVDVVSLLAKSRKSQRPGWVDIRAPFDEPFPTEYKLDSEGRVQTGASQKDLEMFREVLLRDPAATKPRPRTLDLPTESPPPTNAPTQTATGEKYEVLCQIGEGGMAYVYLARLHGAMGFKRLIVLKTIKEELNTDDRIIRLFLDEARLAAGIDHPNVVRVLDLGRASGSYYMALEYVHGRSLASILDKGAAKQRVPSDITVSIISDLCAALGQGHRPDARGKMLVHRDVTPANVMLSFDGVVKLADFGLAGYEHLQKDKLREGQIIGSYPYLAPELLRGEEASPQTDVWNVGLLLYILTTGRHPFRKSTPAATANAILEAPLRRPWFQMPRKLFSVIQKSTEKDRNKRYPHADALAEDLQVSLPNMANRHRISRWLGELFEDELKVESAFTSSLEGRSFTDSLLRADAKIISVYFRRLLETQGDTSPEGTTAQVDSGTFEPLN